MGAEHLERTATHLGGKAGIKAGIIGNIYARLAASGQRPYANTQVAMREITGLPG